LIVRVRIAPIERWCPLPARIALAGGRPAAGEFVEIETTSMRQDDYPECGGKTWRVVSAHSNVVNIKTGKAEKRQGWRICEHMLEMD